MGPSGFADFIPADTGGTYSRFGCTVTSFGVASTSESDSTDGERSVGGDGAATAIGSAMLRVAWLLQRYLYASGNWTILRESQGVAKLDVGALVEDEIRVAEVADWFWCFSFGGVQLFGRVKSARANS